MNGRNGMRLSHPCGPTTNEKIAHLAFPFILQKQCLTEKRHCKPPCSSLGCEDSRRMLKTEDEETKKTEAFVTVVAEHG